MKLSEVLIVNNQLNGGGIDLFNRHEKENMIELTANENVISSGISTGFSAGAHYWAESGKTMGGGTLIIDVSGNQLTTGQAYYSIHLTGGARKEEQNQVINARIVENSIEANGLTSGIGVSGGEYEANHNSVLVDIKNNSIRGSFAAAGIGVIGGVSGGANTTDADISSNLIGIVKDSYAHGLYLTGGTDDCQGNCQVHDAISNLLASNVTANSVQIEEGNRSDVTVWGASKNDASSIVRDNQALVNITRNIVSRGIICSDNVPDNTAKCVCQDNTTECTTTASAAGSGSRSRSSSVSTRWMQQLTGHQGRVMAREQEFREKAKQTNDPQLSLQYLEIADRFHDLSDRLATRLQRGW